MPHSDQSSSHARFWQCATCGVEFGFRAKMPGACPICNDERQYLPPDGQQRWRTDDETSAKLPFTVAELEPHIYQLTTDPAVGIGQRSLLVKTGDGNLLWDPLAHIDEGIIQAVRELGGIRWIAASHPHMFGVQLAWSEAFADAPVYVNADDLAWVMRSGNAITPWSGSVELTSILRLIQVGGHFKGSSVALFAGLDEKGAMLASDTIVVAPRAQTITILRSYPNRIPLSPTVIERIRNQMAGIGFDRLYSNFAGQNLMHDAKAAVLQSTERLIAWGRGDNDSDT